MISLKVSKNQRRHLRIHFNIKGSMEYSKRNAFMKTVYKIATLTRMLALLTFHTRCGFIAIYP